jgi:transglutaminase-like putative cysteine protease
MRSSALLARVRDWTQAVITGEAAFDLLAAALVWSLVLWTVSLWAGWAVRRRQRPLQALAPAGALLLVSMSYTWADPNLLAVLLGAALLLVVLTQHIAREARWQSAGTDFSPELRLDLALVTVPTSLALVTAALLAPSISVRPIVNYAQRLMVEHLSGGKQVADSMGLEPSARPGIALNQARAGGLPNQSLIGSGTELSEQVVMIIYPEGLERVGSAPDDSPESAPRLYWRALTHDAYTGRGWRTGETEMVTYRAGDPAGWSETLLNSPVHRILRQEVQVVDDLGGLLYRAGELVTADHDYRVAWRSPDDAFGAEIDAQVYRADSLLPIVSEAQLRAAGDDYPKWVRDRYLTLPPEIPERVLSLAQKLTAPEPTAYDQAHTIESYLRTFTYTLDLPAPPPDRDVADYFLFDLKQGYCDYYATTMVVLARAAGLPARFVTGYVNGTYDADKLRYVVTAADAHAWAEVYFPGHGWIEFEPTGGRPAIQRPAEIAPAEIPEPETPLEPRARGRFKPTQLIWLVPLAGLPFLALGGLAWWVGDSWRLRRRPPAEVVSTLYQRLYRHGQRLAVPMEAGDTPYEFEAGLRERVATLAQDRRWGETLATTDQEVRWLTDLYVQGLYSPHEPDPVDRSRALKRWQGLRRRLWLAWIWQRMKVEQPQ